MIINMENNLKKLLLPLNYDIEKIKSIPLIIIEGPMASGKGTLSSMLVKKFGFSHKSVLQTIKEMLFQVGIKSPSRKETDEMEKPVKEVYGETGFAKMLLSKIDTNTEQKGVVIEGFRFFSDVEFFTQLPHATTIWLEASPEVRFKRVQSRRKDNDLNNWEDFVAKDVQENRWMKGIKEIANLVLNTEKPQDQVEAELVEAVKEKYKLI